ncbi:ABC transporter ATP-binding protein [Carnobacterium maltaromaticum]|uniref:ABC transporter ATP-binding protein n=1 Tax=Carnobacterium maltaromaticum TaxID=2751 RepID=A0AAW9K2D9_CARML|nr:ABC transporter ATP-binding protein [Carnobacterium maltaromaticum]
MSKSYNGHQLFEKVSLNIPAGAAIALVGHNGAGKSTLLKIIGGLIPVNQGSCTLKHGLKLCYVPEHFPKTRLTVKSYLKQMGLIEGLTSIELETKIDSLLAAYFMTEMENTVMSQLSKGSLQKVGVMQAFLTTSDILLLDEPLAGQDSDSQKVFIRMVTKFLNQGGTIVMSCHEPYLVQRLANTVYQVADGRIKLQEIIAFQSNAYDYLVFQKLKDDLTLPEDIQQLAEKIDETNQLVRLIVRHEASTHIILTLLPLGYELRGLECENL